MVTEVAWVALGSNLGDRTAYLSGARTAVASIAGCRLLAVSSIDETAPCGGVAQGPYLNQMVVVASCREPLELLDELKRIEHRLGRIRGQRWGSRTIDLDLVRFGTRRLSTPELTLPHSELPSRTFWRRELAELTSILTRVE